MSLYLGTTPITPAIPDVANQSLSNLNSTGKNIANWSSNITNCLTEIPQDIKLELSSGTLTLKAGSKVYVPNGTDTFDVETVESDYSTTSTGAAQMYICKISGGGIFGGYMTGGTVTERPSTPINYAVYYNTTTNICEAYWSGAWHTLSFPIAIATRGSSGYESIDQVFNGFGYIGSSVFVLPGVKGLIPNGRNDDGTLKNISFDSTTVKTADMSNGNRTIIIQDSGRLMGYLDTAYYEDENIIKNSSGDIQLVCYLGHVIVESGAITRFETKSAFHAIDYSDSPTIAGWALPSNQYIELTLGASDSTYTAPANGWFAVSKTSGGTGKYIGLLNTTSGCGIETYPNVNNNNTKLLIPVKKNDVLQVIYSLSGATQYFRFIYAEGEPNV